MHARSRASRMLLVLAALLPALLALAAGCRTTKVPNKPPYTNPKRIDEPSMPPYDPDFPIQVEKVQVGPGGPTGYIRVQTRWLDDRKRQQYTTTWVYDTSFRGCGMWAETGDTVRFRVDGREENLGILPRSVAFYTLLTGRDRFPEDVYEEPEVLYLKIDEPRTGREKPAAPGEGEGEGGTPAGEGEGEGGGEGSDKPAGGLIDEGS